MTQPNNQSGKLATVSEALMASHAQKREDWVISKQLMMEGERGQTENGKKKIKPQKVHKEKSLSWLSVSQETEKKVIEAACNVQEHRQNQRPTLTRRLAVMGSRMRAT